MSPSKLKQSIVDDPFWQRAIAKSWHDTAFFTKTFLPEWVKLANTAHHKRVYNLIDDDTKPFVAVCGYRGMGKSTLAKAYIIKSILLRKHRFIMVVGKSHDYAASLTEDIKTEILANKNIRDVFGDLKPREYQGLEPSFSKKAWFLSDPTSGEPICYVLPKGAGQQVRGANVRIAGALRRPDFILIDDLEDDKEVLNEDLRRFTRSWLYGSLLPCVDEIRPDAKTGLWKPNAKNPGWTPPWRVFFQDTLKHHDAEMARALQSDDWYSERLPQAESRKEEDGRVQYYTLVPERISTAQVRAEIVKAKENGTFDEYCREKLCLPLAPDNACWTRDIFKYYNDNKLGLSKDPNIERAVIVDPARTANQRSAYSAILGFGADLQSGKIYIRDLINKRLHPEEIVDKAFEMCIALNAPVLAVEVSGLSEHIKWQFTTAASQRGLDIEFVWLEARSTPKSGDYGTGREAIKRARAAQILPYYRRGIVYHEDILRNSALEEQQLSFPLCTHWDALDCAGYIPQILELGGRYFIPQAKKATRVFDYDFDYDDFGKAIASGSWRTC